MDIAAGMSAFKSFYLYLAAEISGRYIHLFIGEFGYGVYAARTADEQFSLIFRIEIQQDVTAHETFL